MSEQRHTLSRANVLIDITNAQFRETGSTAMSFSEILFNVFCEYVPENQRTGLAQIRPWKDKEGDAKSVEANYKRFQRYMDGTTAIPMDLEEAWVDCLLDKYHARAVVALCSRHGAAAIELDHEMNYDDGIVDEKDRDHVPEFEAAVKELISVAGGLLKDVQGRLGPDPELVGGRRSVTH